MKIGRLYIKIFLSFLLVLFVTEILIFGFFSIVIGKKIHEEFEKNIGIKTLLVKELLEEKIKAVPETDLSKSELLRDLISRIGDTYNAKAWLSGPGGIVTLKSFDDSIPADINELSEESMGEFEGFKIYSKPRRRFGKYYLIVPIKFEQGVTGDLHIFVRRQWGPEDHPGGPFAIGLAVIGIIIALLINPVTRNISKPIKHLRESALRIAEGDLSRRAKVRSRDEIGELGHAFNRMADKLERMIRGGRELTANVSHELRTPLARIRIAEQLLREKWEKGELKNYNRHLNEIQEDIRELDRLIGRILELSKLDIHERPLDLKEIDPVELIEELLEKLRPAMELKKIRLSSELSFAPPLFAEKETLGAALSNILDNAVKFTPEGGDIIVKTHLINGSLHISITNSFKKLTDEDLDRIFEAFYRTEKTSATGSGLGLAIAKKNIERHGGSIWARNTDEGLQVEIDLPSGQSEKEI